MVGNDPCHRIKAIVKDLVHRQQLAAVNKNGAASSFSFVTPVVLRTQGEGGKGQELGEGWGVEVSMEGLSCVGRHPLRVDHVVLVNIPPLLGGAYAIPMRVVTCSAEVNGMYKVVGRFLF